MRTTRQQQVSRVLREELSRIIREEMNDPRLGFISITTVEMTPDLKIAHVYISVYGTPDEQAQSMQVLDRATSFLRGELSRQVEMRHTPELRFHLDKSIERGARVFELLQHLPPPAAEPDETTDEKQPKKDTTDDQG